MKLKTKVNSVFWTPDAYFDFCIEQSKIQERPIFGNEAVKLKKQLDKDMFPTIKRATFRK